MTLKENIMKLQTYKMFEGEDTLYVERDDVLKLLEQELCDDVISRQAVRDALYKLCNTNETLIENPWRDNPHIDALIDAIEELPSVNPQEPTGHWEWLTEDKYRCSNCNSETRVDECMNVPMYEFCPFCGAKMAESEE